MKILVTGHKGFIGQNMVRALEGHELSLYEYDGTMPSVEGLDWVVHIGAISSTTERDIEKIMTQNYDFSVNLLNDCIKHNVHFQYSSSASVYGLVSDFSETSPVDPKTPYAWSKYLFERYTQAMRTNIRIQGFRYFNVYGPGEDHKGDQASPFHKFAKQERETGKVKVFENSESYSRDFVHVDVICKTHIDFFDVPESGIWNVGMGRVMSFMEVAKKFSDNIETFPMPSILKDSYQKYTCANMTKTHNTLKKYKGELV